MIKSKGLESNDYRKVTVTLNEQQEDLLDSIRNTVKKGRGSRISCTEIVRAAIENLRTLSIDLLGVRDEKDLLDKIKKAQRKSTSQY